MNTSVFTAACNLVERAKAHGHVGTMSAASSWEQLNSELGGVIPSWYVELVTTIPLCNLEFGWQECEPEGNYDGVAWLQWLDVQELRGTLLNYPIASSLLKQSYLCVAHCSHGSDDEYFLPIDQGNNPPLYQVDHEEAIYQIEGEATDVMQAAGRIIAPSLSQLFASAKTTASL